MDNVQNVTESQNSKKSFKNMKKSTKITLIVLSIVFMLTAVIVPVIVFTAPKDSGYQTTEKGDYLLRYRPGGDYYDIVSYIGTDIEVVVPAEIDGVRVRGILEGAFSATERASNKNIKSVVFETKVDKLTNEEFGVETIGNNVFEGCSELKEVSIPQTIVSIGAEAFVDSGLEKLIVENAGTLKLEQNALTGADNLKTIKINGGKVTGSNLKNYNSGENVDNIEIGDNVSEVSPDAFNGLNVSTLSVYNIDNDSYLNTQEGEIRNSITTVNILYSNKVLTQKFMDKVALYCGSTVNTINIYPGINIIESGAFTSNLFTQFANYGNNIYLEDSAVIDVGAVKSSSQIKFHLRKAGDGNNVYKESDSYTLNISASSAQTIVTSSFMSKFDQSDLDKVKVLNFSGKAVKAIDGTKVTLSSYTDESNTVVVKDGIDTFDQDSLSLFNYNEDGLEYIIFGNAVNNIVYNVFGNIESPVTFAAKNTGSGNDLLANVNIYGSEDYNSTVFRTFNRVKDDTMSSDYKEIFLSRASYNTKKELASRWLTFNPIGEVEGVWKPLLATVEPIEAKMGDTVANVLGTAALVKGYEIDSWYTTQDFSGNSVVLEDIVVGNATPNNFYAKCTPIKVRFSITFIYDDNETERPLTEVEGVTDYATKIFVLEEIAKALASQSYNKDNIYTDLVTKTGYIVNDQKAKVYGFVVDGTDATTYRLADSTDGKVIDIPVDLVRPTFTIKFVDDQNNDLTTSVSVKYGEEFDVPTVNSSDDSKELKHWENVKNTKVYNPESKAKIDYEHNPNEVVYLKAIWQGVETTVTIKYNEVKYVKDQLTGQTQEQFAKTLATKEITMRVGDILTYQTDGVANNLEYFTLVAGQEFDLQYEVKKDNNVVVIKYTRNAYELSFVLNGGAIKENGESVTPTISRLFEEKYVKSGENNLPGFSGSKYTIERVGYSFVGWMIISSKNSQTTTIINDQSKLSPEGSEFTLSDMKTLYAIWEDNTYNVTINLDGGTVNPIPYLTDKNGKKISDLVVGQSQEIKYSDRIYINQPTKDGFAFNGWTIGGEKVNVPEGQAYLTMLYPDNGASVELKATYVQNPYTIVVALNGGNINGQTTIETLNTKFGADAVEIANPTKEGHVFIGWAVTGDYNGSYSNLTFVNGFTFNTEFKNLSTKLDGVVTLTAQWQANTYVLSFIAGDGTGTSNKTVTFTFGSSEFNKLPTIEELGFTAPDGRTFKQWQYNGKGLNANENYTAANVINTLSLSKVGQRESYEIEMTAIYVANEYQINLDLNGTGATIVNSKIQFEAIFDENVNIPNPERTGYEFLGWITNDELYSGALCNDSSWDGSNSVKDAVFKNLVTNGEVTLKATWKANTYEASFDLDGGEFNEGTIEFNNGGKVDFTFDVVKEIPHPVKDGFTFTGWTITSGNLYSAGAKTGVTNTEVNTPWKDKTMHKFFVNLLTGADIDNKLITLKATWSTNVYNIQLDSDGGTLTNGEDSFTVNYDEPQVVYAPTKNGYKFLGWQAISGLDIVKAKVDGATWNGSTNVGVDKEYITFETLATGGTVYLKAVWEALDAKYTVYGYIQNVFTGVDDVPVIDNSLFDGTKFESIEFTNKTGTVLNISTLADQILDTYASLKGREYEEFLVLNHSNVGNGDFVLEYNTTTEGMKVELYFVRKYVKVVYNTGRDGSGNIIFDKNDKFSVTKYYSYSFADELVEKNLPLDIFNIAEKRIVGWDMEDGSPADLEVNKLIKNNVDSDKVTQDIVLTANLNFRTYNIQYNLNDGSWDVTHKHPGQANIDGIVEISNPQRPGHVFLGWELSAGTGADTSYAYTGETVDAVTSRFTGITKNTFFKDLTSVEGTTVTLVAKWQEKLYSFTFYGSTNDFINENPITENGFVNPIKNIPFNTGSQVTIQETAVKNGYKFLHWVVAGTGIVISAQEYALKTLLDNCGADVLYTNTDIKLVAVWEEYEYTINFAEKEGNTSSTTAKNMPSSQSYEYEGGGAVNLPTNPTKVGYRFTGWTFANGNAVTNYDSIAEFLNAAYDNGTVDFSKNTITVYANWEANVYTIEFYNNTVEKGGTKYQTYADVKFDTQKTIAYPTKTGFRFMGWDIDTTYIYLDEDGVTPLYRVSNDSETQITTLKNLTSQHGVVVKLYATWGTNGYNVEYRDTGITSYPTPFVEFGKDLVLIDPVKTGWKFDGWDIAVESGDLFSGHSIVEGDGKYTFKNLSAINNDNVVFTAKWIENTYTINVVLGESKLTYNSQDYTGNALTIENVRYSQNITLADPVLTGYNFIKWTVSVGGSTQDYTNANTDAQVFNKLAGLNASGEVVTITAVFDANLYTIEVTGDAVTTTEYPANFSASVEIESPTRTGYTFAGWKATSGFNNATALYKVEDSFVSWSIGQNAVGKGYTKVTFMNLATTGIVTLVATWTPNEYTVQFNGNGSTGGSQSWSQLTDNKFNYESTALELPQCGFVKVGYRFNGWSFTENGTIVAAGKVYANAKTLLDVARAEYDGATRYNTGTITIYANWLVNNYTIKFNANDNDGGSTKATATANLTPTFTDGVTLPSAPERVGYRFTGWSFTNGGEKVNAGTRYSVKEVFDLANSATLEADRYNNNSVATLYANWEAIKYTIITKVPTIVDGKLSTDEEDYEVNTAAQNVIFDSTTVTIENAELVGYTFLGWEVTGNYNANTAGLSLDANGRTKSTSFKNLSSTNNGSVTLVAHFSASSFTVTAKGTNANVSFVSSANANSTLVEKTGVETEGTVVVYGKALAGYHGPLTFTIEANANNNLNKNINVAVSADGTYATITGYDAAFTVLVSATVNKYNVVFNANDSVGSTRQDIATDGQNPEFTGTVVLPSDPTRTGYTFAGWSLTLGGSLVNPGTTYTVENLLDETDVTNENNATITIYANWTAKPYTIEIYNGYEANVVNTLTANFDTAKDLPTVSRDGYVFSGWTIGGTGVYNDRTLTNTTALNLSATGGVVTLTATWGENGYTINYQNLGDNTFDKSAATFDEQFTLTNPEVDGYTFAGWDLTVENGTLYASKVVSNDGTQTTFAKLTQDDGATVTIKALWTNNTYTVNFVDKGNTTTYTAYYKDTVVETTGTPTGASEVVTLSVPTPATGYHFTGFVGTNINSSIAQADGSTWDGTITNATVYKNLAHSGIVTITSVYESNAYQLAFNAGDGEGEMSTLEFFYEKDGQDFTIPTATFTKTGYHFSGWTRDDSVAVEAKTYASVTALLTALNINPTDNDAAIDATLTANWEANTYTVVKVVNGHNYGSYEFTYDQDDTTLIQAFANQGLNGYTYLGWVASGDDFNRDTAMYYDNADSTWKAWPTAQNYAYANYFKNLTAVENGEVTLTAEFAVNEYTISFNKGAGTGSMTSVTYNYKTSTNLDLTPTFVPAEGYHFTSWLVNGNTVETTYENVELLLTDVYAGQTVDYTVTELELVAQYEVNKFTVVFDGNDNTSGNTTWAQLVDGKISYTDTALTLPTNEYVRDGYHFNGWSINGTVVGENQTYATAAELLTVAGVNPTVDGSEITITANWEVNTYTVTFDDNDERNDTSISSVVFTYTTVTKVEMPAIPNTKAGYTFEYWALNTEGGAEINIGPSYTNNVEQLLADLQITDLTGNKTVHLVAVWSANTNTEFSVKVYIQNKTDNATVLDEGYRLDNTYTFEGTTDQKVVDSTDGKYVSNEALSTAVLANYSGHSAYMVLDHVEYEDDQTTITVAGTVVNVYYKLQYVKVIFTNTETNAEVTRFFSYDFDNVTSLPLNIDGFTLTGSRITAWLNGDDDVVDNNVNKLIQNEVEDLYAEVPLYTQWSAKAYDISYDLDGGVAGSKSPTTATIDIAVEISNPTKAGYTFKGWYLTGRVNANVQTGTAANNLAAWADTASGNRNKNTFFMNLAAGEGEAVVMHAEWIENTYTIVFDKGESTDAINTMNSLGGTYTSSTPFNVTTPSFTAPVGKKFAKWVIQGTSTMVNTGEYTVQSFLSTYYSSDRATYALGTTDTEKTITLVAVWEYIKYTLQTNIDGVISTVKTGVSFDESITLTDPEKNGFTFTGWDLSVKNGTLYASREVSNDGTQTTFEKLTQDDGATITLVATWYEHRSDVTVNVGAGKITHAEHDYTGTELVLSNVTYTQAITLADPTRTGYEFIGWTVTVNGSPVDSLDHVTNYKNITALDSATVVITANYEANGYTIVVKDEEGNTLSTTPAIFNTQVTTVPVPTKDNYTFVGYDGRSGLDIRFAKVTVGGVEKLWTEWSKPVKADKFLNLAINEGDTVILDAIFTPNVYKITANGLGTNADESRTVPVYYDADATLALGQPTRNGYTFTGWTATSLDANAKVWDSEWVSWTGTITKSAIKNLKETNTLVEAEAPVATLTANWAPNEYTIEFGAGTGSGTMAQVTYNYEKENITLNSTFTPATGRHFTNWKVNENTISTSYATMKDFLIAVYEEENNINYSSHTIKLVAEYVANSYTVDVYNGYEAEKIQTIPATFDSTTVSPAYPVREGYNFLGWTLAAVTIGADLTTAKYVAGENKYTWNGGAINVSNFYNLTATHEATVSLTAVWEFNSYTIKFNSNEGSAVADVEFVFLQEDITISVPTRTGYQFTGWKLADNTLLKNKAGETVLSSTTYDNYKDLLDAIKVAVTNNGAVVTLTAQWSNNEYTITFDSAEGSDVASVIFKYLDENILINVPTRVGYTFNGWKFADSSFLMNEAGAKVLAQSTYTTYDKLLSAIGLNVNSHGQTVALTADWTANTYTLTFDYDDGATIDKVVTLTYDQTITGLPIAPTRTGYQFADWWNGGVKVEFASANYDVNDLLALLSIDADNNGAEVTLTAKWTSNTYTIAFENGNADATGSMSSMTIYYNKDGQTLTIPGLSYALVGYHFLGWKVDGGAYLTNESDESVGVDGVEYSTISVMLGKLGITNVDENGKVVTLTADWEINTYTMTFCIVSRVSTYSTLTVNGEVVTIDGMSKEYTVTTTHGTDLDVVFVATNAGKHYYVTTNIGVWKEEASIDNYSFTYTWENPTTNSYDVYIYIYEVYEISFDKNTGSGDDIDNLYKWHGTSFTAFPENNLTLDGYTANGWQATNAALVGTRVTTYSGNENKIFYANWTENSYYILVSYGNGQQDEHLQKKFTEEFTLAEPEKEGYTFTGWNLYRFLGDTKIDVYSGAIINGNTFAKLSETNNNVFIVAQYVQNIYTIKVTGEGVTETTYDATFDGSEVVIANPTRTGYTFAGWIVSGDFNAETANIVLEDGKTKATTFKNLASNNGDEVVLTVSWTEITYYVSISLASGKLPSTPTYTHKGSTTEVIDDGILIVSMSYEGVLHIENPTRIGYNFTGWQVYSSEDSENLDHITFDTDLTKLSYVDGDSILLQATWEAKSEYDLTIEFDLNTTVDPTIKVEATEVDLGGVTFEDLTFKTDYAFVVTVDGTYVLAGTTLENQGVEDASYTIAWTPELDNEGNLTNGTVTVYVYQVYTVSYDKNTGTGSDKASQTKIYGETINLAINDLAKTGYKPNGWNTLANGTGTAYASSAEYSANANLPLFADWTANTYILVMSIGIVGGNGFIDTITYGETITGIPYAPTATGRKFISWQGFSEITGKNEVVPFTKDNYVVNDEFLEMIGLSSPDNDGSRIALYGQWQDNTYTLTFDYNDGETADRVETLSYDGTVSGLPTNPTRDGYTFNGWMNGADAVALTQNSYNVNDLLPLLSVDPDNDGAEVTLVATWEENFYRAQINLDGGKLENVQVNGSDVLVSAINGTYEVDYTSTIKLSVPSKDGYTFKGWTATGLSNTAKYETPAVGQWTEGKKIGETSDVTVSLLNNGVDNLVIITANWEVNEYTVYVDYNGGEKENETRTEVFGNSFTLDAGNYTGYTFTGWTVTAETGTTLYSGKIENGNTFNMLTAQAGGKVTITANWSHVPVSYRVTYGDIVNDALIHTVTDTSIQIKVTIGNDSYVLNYGDTKTIIQDWANDTIDVKVEVVNSSNKFYLSINEKPTTATTTINEINTTWDRTTDVSIVVYAYEQYTIDFDGNGYTGGEVPERVYAIHFADTVIPANTLEKTGYTANGWNISPTSKLNPDYTTIYGVNQSTTLYANWTINTYTLTIKFVEYYGYSNNYALALFINNNYVDGLYINDSFTYSLKYGETINVKLSGVDAFLKVGSRATINDSRENMETTWTPDATNPQDAIMEIYATQGYTIVFDGNGNTSGSTPAQMIVTYSNEAVTLPTLGSLAKVGHTGENWSTTSTYVEGGITSFTPNVEHPFVFLYANWREHTYTINVVDESGIEATTLTKNFTEEFSLPTTIVRTGYTFNGWTVTAETGTELYASAVTSNPFKSLTAQDNGVVIITANWTEHTYNINIVYGNGTASELRENVNFTDVIELENPTKTGYTFAGWVLEKASNTINTSTALADENSWKGAATFATEFTKLTPDDGANLTLKATWTEKTYTVTVKCENGETDQTMTAAFDTSYTLTVPDKTGYTFTGWVVTAEEGTTLYASRELTNTSFKNLTADNDGRVILTAQYREHTYNVTIKLNDEWICDKPNLPENKDFVGVIPTLIDESGNTISSGNFTAKDQNADGDYQTFTKTVNYTDRFFTGYPFIDKYLFCGWTIVVKDADGDIISTTHTSEVNLSSLTTIDGASVEIYTEKLTYRDVVDTNNDGVAENEYGQLPRRHEMTFSFSGLNVSHTNVQVYGDILTRNGEVVNNREFEVSNGGTFKFYFWEGETFTSKLGFVDNGHSYVMMIPVYENQTLTYEYLSEYSWNVDGTISMALSMTFELNVYEIYTISYKNNDNSFVTTETVKHGDDYTLLENTLLRTGYIANGWQSTNNTFVGTRVDSIDDVNADTVFYANWTANRHEVAFELDGGSLGTISGLTYDSATGKYYATFDTQFSIATPTRTNYTFAGWTTASSLYSGAIGGAINPWDGTALTFGPFTNLQTGSKVILVANWTPNKIDITLDGAINFGSDHYEKIADVKDHDTLISNITITPVQFYDGVKRDDFTTNPHGVYITEQLEIVTQSSNEYNFVGWYYIDWSGSNPVLTEVSDITNNIHNGTVTGTMTAEKLAELYASGTRTLTIFAVWDAIEYSVTISHAVRYTSQNTTLHTAGQSLTVNGLTGATFNTWISSSKGGTVNHTGDHDYIWSVTHAEMWYGMQLSRTGSMAFAPLANAGYHFVGYSSNNYIGTTTDVAETGEFAVTLITSDVTVYYYWEANTYDLTVDYGEGGDHLENGQLKGQTHTFTGLISDVAYNEEILIGDGYKKGFKPTAIDTTGTTAVVQSGGFYWNATAPTLKVNITWERVRIWIESFDAAGNPIANGADIGNGKTFNRYYNDSSWYSDDMWGTLVAKYNVYVSVLNGDYSTDVGKWLPVYNSTMSIPTGKELVITQIYGNKLKWNPATININGTLRVSNFEFAISPIFNGITVNNGGILELTNIQIWPVSSPPTYSGYLITVNSGATAILDTVSFTEIDTGTGIIYSAGTLEMTDCTFTDNTVPGVTLEEVAS